MLRIMRHGLEFPQKLQIAFSKGTFHLVGVMLAWEGSTGSAMPCHAMPWGGLHMAECGEACTL